MNEVFRIRGAAAVAEIATQADLTKHGESMLYEALRFQKNYWADYAERAGASSIDVSKKEFDLHPFRFKWVGAGTETGDALDSLHVVVDNMPAAGIVTDK